MTDVAESVQPLPPRPDAVYDEQAEKFEGADLDRLCIMGDIVEAMGRAMADMAGDPYFGEVFGTEADEHPDEEAAQSDYWYSVAFRAFEGLMLQGLIDPAMWVYEDGHARIRPGLI